MRHGETGNDDDDRTRDTNTGKFGKEYPDEAFLEAVENAGHASTTGVADRVGCTRQNAHKRLTTLEDAGEVEGTDLGNNIMWTRSTEN